ncbi:MAG: hypothetical protein JWO96_718 [Candidatus Saccharibacteria bacterium]|nr:hypothetical protein [Candidatus Saccharibacteria bacterium]
MSEDEPLSREQQLFKAKDQFRETMLANDTFFRIVQSRLKSDSELPDFGCEPTYKAISEDAAEIGVELSFGTSGESQELSFRFAQLNHITLGTVELGSGRQELTPSDEIIMPDEELATVVESWQSGWSEIINSVGKENLGIDPLKYTVELKEKLDATVILSE